MMIRIFTALLLLVSFHVQAQMPGKIIVPTGSYVSTPLNPNGDGYTSKTSAGFKINDSSESEIRYKSIIPVNPEPLGDLRRGPNGRFSDLVAGPDGAFMYVNSDGTNLMFRMRIGGWISGSKGYSALIDTDLKFGNTPGSADPNYIASSSGIDGNPGFEIEVSLQTNFQVAIYNVDGRSSGVLMSTYPLTSHSLVSVAKTTTSGNPDYFVDYYVPISALGLPPGTLLRFSGTTVMAPKGAIGGPASDIFQWEDIENQDPIRLDSLYPAPPCTAAPVITSTQIGTNVSISGTWTRKSPTRPGTATITLYKNNTVAGTTTCNTGSTWTITGLNLVVGDSLYAKAKATGESACLSSTGIKLIGCSISSQTTVVGLAVTCATRKGMAGTRPSGASVRIYTQSTAGPTLYANDNSTTYLITYPTATTWYYNGQNSSGQTDPCTAGANDLNDGSYSITAQSPGFCESRFVDMCLGQNRAQTPNITQTPTITQTAISPSTTIISGTAVVNNSVRLLINNTLVNSMIVPANGAYIFAGLSFIQGDSVIVEAIGNLECLSAPAVRVVTCVTPTTPSIDVDNTGFLRIGNTTVTGSSSEIGASVVLYRNGSPVGVTTVNSVGKWSVTYTIIAGTYTATQQNGNCFASDLSPAASTSSPTIICPSITGTYNNTSTLVNGTLSAPFTGRLRFYIDSVLVTFVDTTNATSFSFPINTNYSNKVYGGAKVMVTAQESGKSESGSCPAASADVTCLSPVAPTLSSPSTVFIMMNSTASFSMNNTLAGILYALTDSTTNKNAGESSFGEPGTLTLVTDTFYTQGRYPISIRAISFDGIDCYGQMNGVVNVFGVLPVRIISFTGFYKNDRSLLSWISENESGINGYTIERSFDGVHYSNIAYVPAAAASGLRKNYQAHDIMSLNGIVYYRLKIHEQSGSTNYSQVIRLKESGTKNMNITLNNPFSDHLNISFYNDLSQKITLELMDMQGKKLVTEYVNAVKGNNTFFLNDLVKFSKGTYLLALKSADGVQLAIEKVVKQ